MGSYKVVSGDTGDKISQKLGISLSALQNANPGVNWNNLQIGQVLNTPRGGGGETTNYKVVSGDTGEKIAQKFGVSFSQLQNANPGTKWNDLQVGQTLKIPGGNDGGNSGSGPGPVDSEAKHYSGPASSFPSQSQWQSFDVLWKRNSQYMRNETKNTAQQITWIQQAINQVSNESNPHIDNRVILCVIMQESSGDVHVPTTDNGVRNPGLMQSHNGAEFDPNNAQGSILQMIKDGTEGTKFGDGYTQLMKQYGNYYKAMRGYNSGDINENNLSDPKGATASYVSDIANRLLAARGF